MSKPKIICFMMTSVDGRIDCPMTAKLPGVEEYYPLLDELGLKSAVSGRVTAERELAEPGKFEARGTEPVGCEAVFKAAGNERGYSIIADTHGTLLWKDDSEYKQPHIILMSEGASKEYLEYLESRRISYVVAGKDKIDLARAVEILQEQFGIERLGVTGGAAINTAFLDAGLLDEVIVLIGAGIDGRADFPPLFNRTTHRGDEPALLKLLEVKTFKSGAVMIRYATAK